MDAGRGGSRQRKARLPAGQGLTGPVRPLRALGAAAFFRREIAGYDQSMRVAPMTSPHTADMKIGVFLQRIKV
jgi:hypothetical protein